MQRQHFPPANKVCAHVFDSEEYRGMQIMWKSVWFIGDLKIYSLVAAYSCGKPYNTSPRL